MGFDQVVDELFDTCIFKLKEFLDSIKFKFGQSYTGLFLSLDLFYRKILDQKDFIEKYVAEECRRFHDYSK